MTFRPSNLYKVTLLCFVFFSIISCNKDSDLLAEYVIEQPQAFMVNDVVMTLANNPIVIDPLSNDTFEEPEKVTVTEVTPPKMGTAEVQEDNTVVYTPDTDKTGTDEFDYTTTVTNEDDTVTTETGSITVTVTPTDKTSPITGDNVYYVTTTGKSSNNGGTEASAWSIQHAFSAAKAGDVVYIKAGNYGALNLTSSNSGTASNPIKFIGYTKNPGDLVSNNGSTFNYGDKLDANKMPLFSGELGKTAITVQNNYVEIENFQITGYGTGVESTGDFITIRNIIATNLGTQNIYDAYDGRGVAVFGNNALVENVFILNANAEAIKLYNSNFSLVNFCSVYGDNPNNPTDYYILLTGGTNNSVVDNSYAERAQGLKHGGHGIAMKDLAEHNVIRNSTARRTSIELNFSGVRYNIVEKSFIYGVDTTPGQWHSAVSFGNGANNNIIRDVHIQDTWTAISLFDTEDGYVGPGGDRDLTDLGFDNLIENITVLNTNRMINVGGGDKFNASAKNYTFKNCTVTNFDYVAVTYYKTENFKFEGCKFTNGSYLISEGVGAYLPYSKFNSNWINCSWSNIKFNPPL